MLRRTSPDQQPAARVADVDDPRTRSSQKPGVTYLDRPMPVLVYQGSSWHRAIAVAVRDTDHGDQVLVDFDDPPQTRMGHWINRPQIQPDMP